MMFGVGDDFICNLTVQSKTFSAMFPVNLVFTSDPV